MFLHVLRGVVVSTVNERAARRWEAERDRRMMAAWDSMITAGFLPQSQTWMKQIDEIMRPMKEIR